MGWLKRLTGRSEAPPSSRRISMVGAFHTGVNPELARDTMTNLMIHVGMYEAQHPLPPCEDVRVVDVVPFDPAAWPGGSLTGPTLLAGVPGGPGTRYERWTVDRCGTVLPFAVAYAPAPKGGTNLKIALLD